MKHKEKILLGVIVVFFIVLLTNILMNQGLVKVDTQIENFLAHGRSYFWIPLFQRITDLGNSKVVLLIIFIAIIVCLVKKKKFYPLGLLIATGGSSFSTWLIKQLVLRQRPPSAQVFLEDSFSFPSGHSTIALALFGFLTYLLIKESQQKAVRIFYLLTGSLIIFLIGFSRLYLGVHWTSDVLGGYLVGGAWLIVSILLTKRYSCNMKHETGNS